MIRLRSVLAIGAALLVSVAGKCTNFNFDVDAEPFAVEDPYTNPYPKYSGGHFRVTPMVNCTAELAQSQGGNGSTCSFHRYAMGLIDKLSMNFLLFKLNLFLCSLFRGLELYIYLAKFFIYCD